MSADFWAGYISGAVGILVGNPLDLLKVRLQASSGGTSVQGPATGVTAVTPSYRLVNPFTTASSLIRGATAPILGYGALNALLFVTYNRSLSFLSGTDVSVMSSHETALTTSFLAGAVGGLATVVVSTPTELIKCRAQLATTPISSYAITASILRSEGLRGLYFGGVVTALRDSIGYGFYFWSYELSTRWMQNVRIHGIGDNGTEVAKVLLCGGIAGVVTWASVFPLDVVKTRVQAQILPPVAPLITANSVNTPLLDRVSMSSDPRIGAWDMAKTTYRTEGYTVFFRGLGVCSIRAFIVNAVQWAVYEWIMHNLRPVKREVSTAED